MSTSCTAAQDLALICRVIGIAGTGIFITYSLVNDQTVEKRIESGFTVAGMLTAVAIGAIIIGN